MSQPLVAVRGVGKSYRATTALDEVSFALDAARVAVLLGRNGAGKSTLLRILGARLVADTGTVHVAGADAAADPVRVRREVGLVLPDARSWYWPLSGRENLRFFGRLGGIGRAAVRDRVDALLGDVELREVADKPVGTYSAGMRARLAVARALLHDPPVLLLDEPSAALDPGIAHELRLRLLEHAARREAAVLWVTHDLHEAAQVADRVLVLDAGRITHDREGSVPNAEALSALLELQ